MLEVKDLSYEYEDGTKALDQITMDFHKGDIVGVIGANGTGKSTLFMNILGLLRPKKGFILWKGEPLKYSKSFLNSYRQEVNMVFQDPDKQIFFSKVYDDVAFSLRNLEFSEEEIEKRVYQALESTQLLEFKERPVHFLSYGQKKRVAIAGILAMDCHLILLDEPTAGLDPRMTEEISRLIYELRDKGVKIILSSHDMNFIYDICDYIYILDKGKLVREGLPDKVFIDEPFITSIGLSQPWLVEIAEKTGMPLFRKPEGCYEYLRKHTKNVSY